MQSCACLLPSDGISCGRAICVEETQEARRLLSKVLSFVGQLTPADNAEGMLIGLDEIASLVGALALADRLVTQEIRFVREKKSCASRVVAFFCWRT
eukprot:SAG11_NODE_114_length_16040_cov_10.050875_5_plen_97_part_00